MFNFTIEVETGLYDLNKVTQAGLTSFTNVDLRSLRMVNCVKLPPGFKGWTDVSGPRELADGRTAIWWDDFTWWLANNCDSLRVTVTDAGREWGRARYIRRVRINVQGEAEWL